MGSDIIGKHSKSSQISLSGYTDSYSWTWDGQRASKISHYLVTNLRGGIIDGKRNYGNKSKIFPNFTSHNFAPEGICIDK